MKGSESVEGFDGVLHPSAPSSTQICVVGDLHGQLGDLLIILEKVSWSSSFFLIHIHICICTCACTSSSSNNLTQICKILCQDLYTLIKACTCVTNVHLTSSYRSERPAFRVQSLSLQWGPCRSWNAWSRGLPSRLLLL